MDHRFGKVKWNNNPRVRTSAKVWNDPYRWQKQAVKDGTRPFVFCASLADIFDNQVDPAWRAEAFKVMRETPNLVYLLLTKRPQNIVKLAEAAGGLPANAAIGATIEDQKRADINVPALLEASLDLWRAETQPLFTFLSCEPLLGPVDLTTFHGADIYKVDALRGRIFYEVRGGRIDPLRVNHAIYQRIDWVITGGETDQGQHKARPSHPDWFRSLRDQCAAAGVPYHHKQNGEFLDGIRVGKAKSGRMLECVIHDAFPEVKQC